MKLQKDNQTLNDVAKLVEFAFDKKESVAKQPVFLSRYNHADCYGFYQNDELTNLIMSNHFTVQIFDKEVKMSGVGYVASHSNYRGQGNIAKLMSELLNDLKEQHVLISQLAPFSESFYRRFGYENTSWQKIYKIPSSAMKALQSDERGSIKAGSWEELKEDIQTTYKQLLALHQVGSLVREDWWWERLDAYYPNRNYCVVYNESNEPIGYAFFTKSETELTLDELIYTDEFALNQLMSYFKRYSESYETFVCKASLHDQLEYYFPEARELTISIVPYMMSRIIDFRALLDVLHFQIDSVVLEVTNDDYAPWNVGRYRLLNGTWQKVEDSANISATIQVWSAVLLGDLTMTEAVRLGKVKVSGGQSIDEFIQKRQQSFYDYF